MTWLILGLISLVLVILWNPVFEHMTNTDIQKKLDFHDSKPTSWHMSSPEKKTTDENKQIMGPLVPPKQDEPKPVDHNSDGSKSSAIYPSIYGPESLKAPGHKEDQGIFTEPTYTGFQEFPKGPSEPAPFLGNYTKFQK